MSGVVLAVVTVVFIVVMTVVTVWDVVQLPPPLRVSADVLNTPPLVRQSDNKVVNPLTLYTEKRTVYMVIIQYPPTVIITLPRYIAMPI